MKYDEVSNALFNAFPELIRDDCSEGLPYCIAGNFANYLLEKYKNNSLDTLVLAGAFIENLYLYKDEEIDNLATVGYLEAIQNVWADNAKEMVKYLGKVSSNQWKKLNKYWNGEIVDLSTNS